MRNPYILIAITTCLAVGCDGASGATASTASKERPMHDELSTPKSAAGDPGASSAVPLHPTLDRYVASLGPEIENIPDDRKKQLDELARFVEDRLAAGEEAELTFICTHNSRRSHMGQLWAATAAAHHGIEKVKTYSGGTEATAFNPRAVAAMKRAGFEIEGGEGDNPHYRVTFSPGAPAQECFSKKYDDPFNPDAGFAAVMTCSQADKSCPIVHGAALRVAVPYVDPKQADGTPEEAATYDARARQVATEMFYLFSHVET